MLRRVVGLGLTLGVGFLTVVAVAADADKPTDWSAWSAVGVWSGEVSKLSKKATGFTLRMAVPPAAGAKGKGTTKSVELTYADRALVRRAKLPPKLDDKGKPVPRTAEELEAAKTPAGAKGYAAERLDLKPGHTVDVTLVRPKELAAKDVQFSDYRIKAVLIVGENPNPPDPPKGKAKK